MKERVCSIDGCSKEGVADLNLELIKYRYDKDEKRTNKKIARRGHLVLCSHHFRSMESFFRNYNGLLKISENSPLYDDFMLIEEGED